MKNFIKKKNIKSIALIVSKPLDLYNAYFFIRNSKIDELNITIFIMKGELDTLSIRSANKFFPKAKYYIFRSGDFYSLFIKKIILKFNAKNNSIRKLNKFLIFNVKIFSYVFSKFYWIPFFLINIFRNRNKIYDLIITDPWASKLITLSTFKFKYLVLQDGGSSTETFRLLDPIFIKNKSKYNPFDIMKRSLKCQKVKIPFYLKNYIYYKIKKSYPKRIFFSTDYYYLYQSYLRGNKLISLNNKLAEVSNSFLLIKEFDNKKINLIKNELFIILGKDNTNFYKEKVSKILSNLKFKRIYIKPHPAGNYKKEHYKSFINELKNYSKDIIFKEKISSFEEFILSNTEFPKHCLLHHDCSTNSILSSLVKKGLKITFF